MCNSKVLPILRRYLLCGIKWSRVERWEFEKLSYLMKHHLKCFEEKFYRITRDMRIMIRRFKQSNKQILHSGFLSKQKLFKRCLNQFKKRLKNQFRESYQLLMLSKDTLPNLIFLIQKLPNQFFYLTKIPKLNFNQKPKKA